MNAMKLPSARPSSLTVRANRRRLKLRAARGLTSLCRLDPLESRTLMSVTFNTVDTFQLTANPPAGTNAALAMTADAAGNVYAAGAAIDAAGVSHAIVREMSGATGLWSTLYDSTAVPGLHSIAVDPAGDIFVGAFPEGSVSAGWTILECRAGQTNFTVVDQISNPGTCYGLTANAAGDVYAVGDYSVVVKGASVERWLTRKLTAGSGAFATVDDFTEATSKGGISQAHAVTCVASGPSAGIYVVGDSLNYNFAPVLYWAVRRSTDGGHTWSTVDKFEMDSNKQAASVAQAVVGDLSGNIYVLGSGSTTVITGYDRKGNPIYGAGPSYGWIVRGGTTNANGSMSWSIADNYQLSSSYAHANAFGVDAAGNVYVAGSASDGTNNHSIVRTLVNGVWTTIDDFQAAPGTNTNGDAFTVDASGNLYVAGSTALTGTGSVWFVRSTAPIATSTATTTTSITTTSSSPDTTGTTDPLADPLLTPLV